MLSTRKIFENHEGNLLHKWDHYFEIYDFHFKDLILKEIIRKAQLENNFITNEHYNNLNGSAENIDIYGTTKHKSSLESKNESIKSIYDNKTIIGASCIAAGYYSYLLSQKNITTIDTPLAVPQHITEIGQVHLPSYNESIGTSEALNMSH